MNKPWKNCWGSYLSPVSLLQSAVEIHLDTQTIKWHLTDHHLKFAYFNGIYKKSIQNQQRPLQLRCKPSKLPGLGSRPSLLSHRDKGLSCGKGEFWRPGRVDKANTLPMGTHKPSERTWSSELWETTAIWHARIIIITKIIIIHNIGPCILKYKRNYNIDHMMHILTLWF